MTGQSFFSEWNISENMRNSKKMMEQQKQVVRKLRRSCLIRISVLVIAIVILFTYITGVGRIKTDAMAPALHAGDLVLFLRCGRPVCGETILYRTKGKQEAGQVMAVDVRADKDETGRGCDQSEFIMILRDHRLDGEDPRRYTTIPEKSVEGTVLAVLRRGK